MFTQNWDDSIDLADPAGGSGTRNYGAARSQHRRVFDKRRVGISFVRVQSNDNETARYQGMAVRLMLLERAFEFRRP